MDIELASFQDNLIKICDQIYKEIGPYGPEKLYQNALVYELKEIYNQCYEIKEEDSIPILYKNMKMSSKRMDITIYKKYEIYIILELKWLSLTELEPYQLSNYMFLKNCKYGFMINFEKMGQHPTEFCADVYDARNNQKKTTNRPIKKDGTVIIQRFEKSDKLKEIIEKEIIEKDYIYQKIMTTINKWI